MLQLRRRAAASHRPLGFEPEDHHLPGLRPKVPELSRERRKYWRSSEHVAPILIARSPCRAYRSTRMLPIFRRLVQRSPHTTKNTSSLISACLMQIGKYRLARSFTDRLAHRPGAGSPIGHVVPSIAISHEPNGRRGRVTGNCSEVAPHVISNARGTHEQPARGTNRIQGSPGRNLDLSHLSCEQQGFTFTSVPLGGGNCCRAAGNQGWTMCAFPPTAPTERTSREVSKGPRLCENHTAWAIS
jgi:hypothetical protein